MEIIKPNILNLCYVIRYDYKYFVTSSNFTFKNSADMINNKHAHTKTSAVNLKHILQVYCDPKWTS